MAKDPLHTNAVKQAQARAQGKVLREPIGEEKQTAAFPSERQPSLAKKQLSELINALERLQLAAYIRYVDDRRRLLRSHFLSGIARGVGMAIGFTVLGAIFVLILQDLARHNLPLIGKLLDEIVNVVQNGMK